jgi:hydroxyacylglutathione hydrolase
MSLQAKRVDLGGVNCYLARCKDGFVLIDSGFSAGRKRLVRALGKAGCVPGNLKIVLLTHGDADHAGNAAFLRTSYRAPIAMHGADSGMVELGDMNFNRKVRADRMSGFFRLLGSISRMIAMGNRFEKFTPDILLEDGVDLSAYGVEGSVVHIPGHSKGSIGILTEGGNLYCGDFAYNMPWMDYVDDLEAHRESMARLKSMEISMVYPGHGKPMTARQLFGTRGGGLTA